MADATCDIGLIGLAVMGQNLVLNMNDHGYKVAVYNRTVSKVDAFLANEAKGTNVVGAHSDEELCKLLKRPRRVMLMVKAGSPVDDSIAALLPYLERATSSSTEATRCIRTPRGVRGTWRRRGYCLSAPV